MKTFIVAALLVACVAGQSLDIVKLNKEPVNSMFKFDRSVYPMAYDTDRVKMVQDYTYDDDTTSYNVLRLEELMAHPRFQEYMTLPIFRQYWSYPMFQRYVCSKCFQSFWYIPSFQQYFMSPVLFYKYIYPIVNLFKYDTTTPYTPYTPYMSGDMTSNKNFYPYNYNNYGYEYYGQRHQNVPYVCRANTVYCKAVVEQFYQHFYNTMMRMPQEEMMMPSYTHNSIYNPIISRMMYGYNKRFPTAYNRFDTVETDNAYPRMFNKEYDNFRYPTKMIDDVATDFKYEQFRPYYNKMNIGMKTYDKVFPEIIEA